jgi:hypothetical protein
MAKVQGPKEIDTTVADAVADVETEDAEDFLPGEGPEETNSESEGNSVTDVTTTPEVEPTNSAEAEGGDSTPTLVVGDLANSVLANATPVETKILDPNSLPADAMFVKVMVTAALEMAKAYDAQRAIYVANTSEKEKKAELYTAALFTDPEKDSAGTALAVDVRDLETELAELQARITEARDSLKVHVDAKLAETDEFWDKETSDAKYAELQGTFKAVRQTRVSTGESIDTYNKHRRPGTPDIGTIDNYVPQIEKPSGGISQAGAKSPSTTSGGGRAPHIARVEIRKPGEENYTWVHRMVGKNDVSNAEILAEAVNADNPDAAEKCTKEMVWAAWLGTYGTSVENLNKDVVPVNAEFDFDFNGKTYGMHITRKVRNPDAAAA